jgi:hypothetical protein
MRQFDGFLRARQVHIHCSSLTAMSHKCYKTPYMQTKLYLPRSNANIYITSATYQQSILAIHLRKNVTRDISVNSHTSTPAAAHRAEVKRPVMHRFLKQQRRPLTEICAFTRFCLILYCPRTSTCSASSNFPAAHANAVRKTVPNIEARIQDPLWRNELRKSKCSQACNQELDGAYKKCPALYGK